VNLQSSPLPRSLAGAASPLHATRRRGCAEAG